MSLLEVFLLYSIVAIATPVSAVDSQCDMLENLVHQLDQGLSNLQADISDLRSKIPPISIVEIPTTNTHEDCDDVRAEGRMISGVYNVRDGDNNIKPVYCEMAPVGNCTWTRILHRQDNLTQFVTQNWTDYEFGFGDRYGSYWTGLIQMNKLTMNKAYKLRVDLVDWDNNTKFAEYSTFRVGSAADKYRLTIGGYSGNAGDSMTFHNRMFFSTINEDNDRWASGNCADGTGPYTGGWWHQACFSARLTGPYLPHSSSMPNQHGIQWPTWKGYSYSYKLATMKIQHLDCTA